MKKFFITRRFILPPTPAADVLVPILCSFLAIILGTLLYLTLPSQTSDVDYEIITYEYYPPEANLVSILTHSKKSVAGRITQHSSTWTFNKSSKTPYTLAQIFRDPAILGELTPNPITAEILQDSFAIDRANQELITSLDGTEQRIKFTDLQGRLNFEFSEPMFGVNPFTYKDADHVDCTVSKCLALTFDDGPSEHTDRLLDILAYTHAKATFFVLGHRVNAFAGQIIRAAREGHDIGSHSWIHRNLPRFPYATILNDLTATTNAIQPFSGQFVRFFRPPYGSINRNVNTAAAALNQQVVLWTVDPWDWQNKDAAFVCNDVIDHVRPGSIILLHDIYSTSVDAAQCIINRLSEQYTFVNLSTLYK
ncbi:polysaccharide deacetylase family protein [Candidatus Saccharibacteria bacterium]|nr:polysaccharide deacetylase family protein [Candidatus Saccharibacteria bacterium]